jgi:type VI secretion system protein ImpE
LLAQDTLKEGDLKGSLEALQKQVRDDPADVGKRIFLFQLLSVMGSWGRALTQLDVAGQLDSQTFPMVQTYREALRCEALRSRVFEGARQPTVLGDPQRWIALAFESVRLCAEQQFAQASELREQAYEDAPETSGRINGEAFSWITDGDTRVGPFVEAIVNGGYYWIPFDRIARVEIDPPVDLRDLVWAPASFTWANGGQTVGFIPSRYPGSADDSDAAHLLCRRTDWLEQAPETHFGRGQRMWYTDQGEYSLLEVRTIEIDHEVQVEPASAPLLAE